MRIVVDRGSNAGSISNYLHRKDKREAGKEQDDPVFHTNMFGRNAIERTEEFRFSSDLNSNVEKICVHYKISFPPGENPDLETKKAIVDDLLSAREHGQNCQFFAIEHHEKVDQHDVHHLHILASSIRLDGSWVDDSFERVKLKQVERDIELKHGLQDCPPKEKGDRNSDPIREWKLREKLQVEGKTLTKDSLRDAINQAVSDRPSMALLVTRLKAEGIEVRFSEFEDGKGISYELDGRSFRGGSLGSRYTFDGLHRYAGVEYLPERDDPLLRELNHFTCEQCRELMGDLDSGTDQSQPELTKIQPVMELQQSQTWEAVGLVGEIWHDSSEYRPKLKTTSFEGYQIQLDSDGEPELYQDGNKVLERSQSDGYRGNIEQADLERLRAWQQFALQQHAERTQALVREQEKARKQQAGTQPEQSSPTPKPMAEEDQELEL